MVNNLKIKKYWLSSLCIVLCSLASFAQNLTDKEIGFDVNSTTVYLKGLGLSKETIAREIAMMREHRQKEFTEMKKEQQSFFQNIASKKSTTGRSAKTSAVPQSEKDVLQTLYNATNGDSWTNKTGWDFSTEVTSWDMNTRKGWYGIVVTDGHVTSIVLGSNNLNNMNVSFPDLRNLPFLETLNLYNNKLLTGPLTNFQYLTSLKNINLNSCQFTDTLLPLATLTKLETLIVTGTNITGTIPDEIYNFKNLKELSIPNSNITGGISSRLSELVNLEVINLHTNPNFGGTIPDQIGNLTRLKHLDISGSGITGPLPASLSNLINLEELTIAWNKIEGTIPTEIGNLNKLNMIWAQTNRLTGTIPVNMGTMPKLVHLLLSSNQLEGTIPISFQSLSSLNFLAIEENSFSNTFPDLSNLTKLTGMRIQSNKFTFADFAAQYSTYKSRASLFEYAPQAKTDAVATITGSPTGSVTLKMHEDGRFTPNQVYQWYKGSAPGGVAIPGATSREYTLSNLKAADAGSYYCVSTEPQMTNTSSTTQNLVLTRNQITLTIKNCTAIAGNIKTTAENFYPNTESNFTFETTATGLTYEWSVATATGDIVSAAPSTTAGSYSYTFSEGGDYIIKVVAKDASGCATAFTKSIQVVAEKYCLKAPIDFAFETTTPGLSYTWNTSDASGTIVHTTTNSTGLYTFTPQLIGEYVIELVVNTASSCKTLLVKNITVEDCTPIVSCTQNSPMTPKVHSLFIALINKLVTTPNGTDVNRYARNEIIALASYTTSSRAKIFKFLNTNTSVSFSFSQNGVENDVFLPKSASGIISGIDLSKYFGSQEITEVVTNYNNGSNNPAGGYVRNIDFCPAADCSPTIGKMNIISANGSGKSSTNNRSKI